MSIYDRDFSKIKAAAVVEGSKVQCQNVLQAALDEIAMLRSELALSRELLNNFVAFYPPGINLDLDRAYSAARKALETK